MDPLENLQRRAKHQVSFFKSGLIANLIIYSAILVVVLVLAGLVWWKLKSSGAITKLDQARQAATGQVVAKAVTWDGKSPFACTGSEAPVIENVTATAGVTANGGCKLTLRNVQIKADVAVTANGSAQVIVEGGALEGSQAAIAAGGNAQVTVKGAKITGTTKKLGGATIQGL